jgi:hypothetical protein
MIDKILQQIVWKLTSDDGGKVFLFLSDIIKARERENYVGQDTGNKREILSAVKYEMYKDLLH